MLNHKKRGIIAFGINKRNKVEEGLNLDKVDVIDQLNIRVGQLLQNYYPCVQSAWVRIQRVDLVDSCNQPTGRWRFDIHVKPYGELVYFTRHPALAYYRQGTASERMPADVMEKLQKASK